LKRSNRLILLIGVFLAIVAFVGILMALQGRTAPSGPPAAPAELPTVFATRAITLGTPITADMLRVENRAIAIRDATAFGDPSLLFGKIARKDVAEGKQLTADDFATTNAPVDVVTPPGQRAMAVQVDQVSGVGTLIRTGDYVDIVVSLTADRFPLALPGSIAPLDPAVYNETSAKLAVQGLQVIGTLLPPPPPQAEGGAPADGGTALTDQQEIVILSVTPQQAEVIKFAQVDGSISLVLRSPQDFRDATTGDPLVPPADETSGITLRAMVDQFGVLVPQTVDANLDPGVDVPTP